MKQFAKLEPHLVEALIDDEDRKLIRENIRHNTLVLTGIAGIALAFLAAAIGMSLSDDQTLRGTPIVIVIAFLLGTLAFFAYYVTVRRKWWAFSRRGRKRVWNTRLDSLKEVSRRSDADSRRTNWKTFVFDDQKYEISEDELGWEQYKKIDQDEDLQFSFSPFMVLYRVERR